MADPLETPPSPAPADPATSTSEEINVSDLGTAGIEVGEPFNPSKFQAETSRQLAIWFIAMLGTSIVVHYAAIVLISIFAKEPKDLVERLEHIFNAWLPVIASLVSSVAAFYFAKAGDNDNKPPSKPTA